MTPMVQLIPIAEGNDGARQTAGRLVGMIQGSPTSSYVRWAIGAIYQTLSRGAGNTAYSLPRSAVVAAVTRWVQERVRYLADGTMPDSFPQAEEIRSPDYLLSLVYGKGQAWGDCDDFVALIGALLYAAGIAVRLILVQLDDEPGYSHVYLEAGTERGWLAVDAIHGAPVGWSIPVSRVRAREVVGV